MTASTVIMFYVSDWVSPILLAVAVCWAVLFVITLRHQRKLDRLIKQAQRKLDEL